MLLLNGCTEVEAPAIEDFPTRSVGTGLSANMMDACVADFDPAIDYFPDKIGFEYSAQLALSYHRFYKRVTFTPTVDTKEVLSLVLVQCGAPLPPLNRDDIVVHVPVARFATSNATMLGAVDDLGMVARLKGVPNKLAVSVPAIKAAIMRDEVLEVGSSTHSNLEFAMALEPQLLFTFYSAYPQSNVHRQLQRLGVPAAPMADHTEITPLGRAEWLKYLALFFNAEKRAVAVFEARAQRYGQLKVLAANAPTRPVVLAGYAETREDWLLPGGRNFLASLIDDAGGRFFNDQDQRAGTLNYVPMERAYEGGEIAERWFGYTLQAPVSVEDFARENPKLAWLQPVREKEIYWLDARKTERRNPYSDQSMARPDDMLADAISAIHPGLINTGESVFLRKIEASSQ